MRIIGVIILFSIVGCVIVNCSRVIFKAKLDNLVQPTLKKKTVTTGSSITRSTASTSGNTSSSRGTKSTSKPPKSCKNIFNLQFNFSLSSMLTGVALTGVGYYYFEAKDLNRKLMRSQLLSGELEGKEHLEKVGNDSKFLKEAVKRGNETLCILLLEIYKGEVVDDLLVKLIEKKMLRVVDYILTLKAEERRSLNILIDHMEPETGKTPLLAALQSKMYPQATKLMKLGAKPLIPAEGAFPTRQVRDFLKEVDGSGEEGKEFLREFKEIYGNINNE